MSTAPARRLARGARLFLAHVQAQNRALFEKLHWQWLKDETLHGRPHCPQVVEMPLEVLLVGEHAEARGAVGFVGAGNGHGIEIGADDALGRAGLLHLGDELDGARRGEGPKEIAHGRRVLQPRTQLRRRHGRLRSSNLEAFGGDNLIEDRRHGSVFFTTETRRHREMSKRTTKRH